MLPRRNTCLLVILILTALLGGTLLGRRLLPPGSIGLVQGLGRSVVQVPAAAAASSSSTAVGLPEMPGNTRTATGGSALADGEGVALVKQPPGNAAGSVQTPRPGRSPGDARAWHSEFQIAARWQDAYGAHRRELRNPRRLRDGHVR
jgi:hypothetical protein